MNISALNGGLRKRICIKAEAMRCIAVLRKEVSRIEAELEEVRTAIRVVQGMKEGAPDA